MEKQKTIQDDPTKSDFCDQTVSNARMPGSNTEWVDCWKIASESCVMSTLDAELKGRGGAFDCSS